MNYSLLLSFPLRKSPFFNNCKTFNCSKNKNKKWWHLMQIYSVSKMNFKIHEVTFHSEFNQRIELNYKLLRSSQIGSTDMYGVNIKNMHNIYIIVKCSFKNVNTHTLFAHSMNCYCCLLLFHAFKLSAQSNK